MLYTIYKIHSDSCDFVYVGSTKAYANRKCQHKRCCNKQTDARYNLKVYTTIRENGGWNSFQMVPIEEFECDTIQQAHIRQQHWIDTLQSNMNMRNCTFNKEEHNKQYYIANQEHIKELKKGYFIANQEYQIANREKINACNRKYQAANREKINAYQREYRKKQKEETQTNN